MTPGAFTSHDPARSRTTGVLSNVNLRGFYVFHSAAPTPDEGSLTRRETEILELVARGLSNNQIVEATSLSMNSVKSFIRSAYRKIGVERREHAIAWALDGGYGREASA